MYVCMLFQNEDKPLVVKMFQYLSWKEDSVPTDVSGMVSLIQRIEKWQQHSGNGPITVTCKYVFFIYTFFIFKWYFATYKHTICNMEIITYPIEFATLPCYCGNA